MDDPVLRNACAGKSRGEGELNMPEFRQALIQLFRDAANEIRTATKSRSKSTMSHIGNHGKRAPNLKHHK